MNNLQPNVFDKFDDKEDEDDINMNNINFDIFNIDNDEFDQQMLNECNMDNLSRENPASNNSNSNNLKFYPFSNNKLTRSTATLNLSLNKTDMASTGLRIHTDSISNNNNNVELDEDVEMNGGNAHHFMNRWSPFSDLPPTTPTLKRTASRSHLSPFINNPDTLKKWNYRKSTSLQPQSSLPSLLSTNVDNQWNNENILNDNIETNKNTNYSSNINNTTTLNPEVFQNNGLKSKATINEKPLYPKKLNMPNTPVKRYPLKDNTNLSNIRPSPVIEEEMISPFKDNQFNVNFMDSAIKNNNSTCNNNSKKNYGTTSNMNSLNSSPLGKERLLNISHGTHTSSINEHNIHSSMRNFDNSGSLNSSSNGSSTNNLNRFKKIKKNRESVVFKNIELTNSLQQFTDELYGTDDNAKNNNNSNDLENNKLLISSSKSPNSISFFNKFPPPLKLNRNSYYTSPIRTLSSDSEHSLNTPTKRKSSIHKRPTIIINSPQQNDDKKQHSPTKAKRHINATIKPAIINPDSHLFEQFADVHIVGQGEFSKVYQATLPDIKKRIAIKSVTPNKHNSANRILQEIKLLAEIKQSELDREGKEYVIDFVSSWKNMDTFYIMTTYYENGNLDHFLQDQITIKKKRLEDWRIWKIIVELCLALRFIHDSCSIVHLDLKPANIMISFEGNLKLADFGMATHLPLEDVSFENEGDREYIAPEIISECIYDFRADIFSLGLMIVEIAANVILPDNGNAWHKLRSGDLSDAGRLSSTEIHPESLFSGTTKIDTELTEFESFFNMNDYSQSLENSSNSNSGSHNTIHNENYVHNNLTNSNKNNPVSRMLSTNSKIPAWVPKFLIDGKSLEKMVKWMIEPDYNRRPTADEILQSEECQYVEVTRKAGAIVQEDDFGPKPVFFEL